MREENLFTTTYELFNTKTTDTAKAIDMLYLYKELRLQIEDKPYNDKFIKDLYECFDYITQHEFSYCIDDFVMFLVNRCDLKMQSLEELDLEEIKNEFTES